MNDRKYLIVATSELKKVNWDEVMETNKDSLNYSVDGKKTFVKWTGETPSFVETMRYAHGPYTHAEIKEILKDPFWSPSLSK